MFNKKLKLQLADLETRLSSMEREGSRLEQEIERRLAAQAILDNEKDEYFGLARYYFSRRSDRYIEELAKQVIATFPKED